MLTSDERIDTDALKARIDLVALVGRTVKLRFESTKESEKSGACPRCGGRDRLHVKPSGWMCRQCHPQWSDAIAWVQWLYNVPFLEAVQMLDATALPTAPVRQHRTVPDLSRSVPAEWDQVAIEAHLETCQLALPDSPGAAYLLGRGLKPATWGAYLLGYDAARSAIAMPWYRGGTLNAINYRLLDPPPGQRKNRHEPGGRPGGLLFGAHALAEEWHAPRPNGTDPLASRSLILVEGEINCMSIWQAVYDAGVDVLSFGGETIRTPDKIVAMATRYRCCIVWKDKRELAIAEAQRIPGAAAYWSEYGEPGEDGKRPKRDANDHLQAGTLVELVACLLWRATNERGREGLRWDLYDAGIQIPEGV